VRDRALHDALREFCLDSAAALSGAVKDGAEVAFDLIEEGARGPALYHYRPRSEEFVGERWAQLRTLESFEAAADLIEPGAPAYARIRGFRKGTSEAVLRDVLDRLYEGASDFAFPEQRFEALAAEIERTIVDAAVPMAVVVCLGGVRLASDRVELDEELSLVAGHAAGPLPTALMGGEDGDRPPAVVCLFEREQDGAAPLPVLDARIRFRRLLTGLRLMGASGARLDPLAWGRAGEGPWRPAPVDPAGDPRPEVWRLAPGDESELRDLLEILGRSRHSGRLAWALARFEMGCARPLAVEALSDHLLALRALLGGSRRDDARLSLRLAALCAEEDDRSLVRHLTERALALEPRVIEGATDDDAASSLDVVNEIEQHLRALLRDLLCGYLDDDLVATADELLLAGGAEGEIVARDLRAERGDGEDALTDEERERRAQIAAPETQEFKAVRREPPPPAPPSVPAAARPDRAEEPVAPDDWGFDDWDEDADCYAGPV
jgi:hypothetical protein